MSTPAREPVLSAAGVRIFFRDRGLHWPNGNDRGVTAVCGADLQISPGEIVGLVGESGSGKTTLALAAARLLRSSGGRIAFRGEDITSLRGPRLRALRRDIQMIFQDPHASLSPRLPVGALLTEPYVIHKVPPQERSSVAELLDMVELPGWMSRSYPHELSGGQARRVGIARALALQPDLIIADEPTAGLDASATSSILNLLEKLRSTNGTAYLVITHALNVVGHLADRIAVMYLGRIVETGPAEAILDDPRHPYTQALMAAIPSTDPERRRERVLLEGEIPSPRNPPAGCHFHPRCPHAAAVCREAGPVLGEVYPGHWAACHRLADLASPAGTRGGPGHAETGAGHGDAGAGKEADSGC